MKMKRRMLIIFCVLAIVTAGTGCGEKAAEGTSVESESSAERPVQEVFEEGTENDTEDDTTITEGVEAQADQKPAESQHLPVTEEITETVKPVIPEGEAASLGKEELENRYGTVDDQGNWIPPEGTYIDSVSGNILGPDGTLLGRDPSIPVRPGKLG